jgi:hypothetical protein
MEAARQAQLTALQAEQPPNPIAIASLENEIAQAAFQAQQPIPVELTADEKVEYDSDWKDYRYKKTSLEKHQGQVYSLVLRQCTQLLKDRMQQDTDWTTVCALSDPLQLYALIKKVVQGQTDDQYVYASVYNQLVGLLGFRQENLTNAQWYEKFNSRVDVATACRVEFEHQVLINYQKNIDHLNTDWANLANEEKIDVKSKSREKLLAYIMLQQSGKKHNDLKYDLRNEFTTGDDKYPDTRQKVLHLMDNYSSRPTQQMVQSEGQSFAQNTQ